MINKPISPLLAYRWIGACPALLRAFKSSSSCFKCKSPTRGALNWAAWRTVLPVAGSISLIKFGEACKSVRITLKKTLKKSAYLEWCILWHKFIGKKEWTLVLQYEYKAKFKNVPKQI